MGTKRLHRARSAASAGLLTTLYLGFCLGQAGGLAAATQTDPVFVPPATIKVVTCPTAIYDSQRAERTPSKAVVSPGTETKGTNLVEYTDRAGIFKILAPAGWHCRSDIGADGSASIIIAPSAGVVRHGLASYTRSVAEAVTADETSTCVGCAFDQACPIFTAADRTAQAPCFHRRPAAEKVDKLSGHLARFYDPVRVVGDGAPSGGPYPATGVLTYTPTAGVGSWEETCTMSPAHHSLCQDSISYFINRYAKG